jgi:enoyl-CoA hydratase/carnithine racemase
VSDRAETRLELEGGVATLTLARPDVRNAITGERMIDEIVAAFAEAEANPGVSVLVVTGEGSAFSAGGNVKEMAQRRGMFAGTPDQIAEGYRGTIQRITRTLLSTDLVTLAAVNGPAVGAGFDLALGCDLRYGSPTARFAHTFVELGIIPGDGGAWLLPRVVGWQRAAELAFTARMVDAEEAVALGVLLEVVPAEELLDHVHGVAQSIAAKPRHSLRMAKRLLRHSRTMGLDEFLDLSASLQAIAHHAPEHVQAVEGYLQRLEQRRS